MIQYQCPYFSVLKLYYGTVRINSAFIFVISAIFESADSPRNFVRHLIYFPLSLTWWNSFLAMWIDFPTLSFVIDKCKNDRYLTFGFNWDSVPKFTISYTKVLYSKLCTCVRLKQRKRDMYAKNAPLIECKVNSVNQMTLRKRQ